MLRIVFDYCVLILLSFELVVSALHPLSFFHFVGMLMEYQRDAWLHLDADSKSVVDLPWLSKKRYKCCKICIDPRLNQEHNFYRDNVEMVITQKERKSCYTRILNNNNKSTFFLHFRFGHGLSEEDIQYLG